MGWETTRARTRDAEQRCGPDQQFQGSALKPERWQQLDRLFHSALEPAQVWLGYAYAAKGMYAEAIERFQKYNACYRERFGFPFVICARLNKKKAILDALPVRLQNSREQEIEAALREIFKIAELRLKDLVE